jgi:hypothetical protein
MNQNFSDNYFTHVKGRFYPPYGDEVTDNCPYCKKYYGAISVCSYTFHLRRCFAAVLSTRQEKWLLEKQERLFRESKERLNKYRHI